MSIRPWKRIERTTILQAKIFTAHKDRVYSPDHDQEFDFFVMEAPDWINVIALTDDEQVVLIRQYRHGTEEVTVEIPGGMVDPGESPLEAAKRELAEETGYRAESWQEIGTVDPNPAFQTNRTWTFLARGARPATEQSFDESEQIEVFEKPLSEVARLLADGTITHALVFGAFVHLALKGDLVLLNSD